MHRAHTRLGHRYIPAEPHYPFRNDLPESHTHIFSEIFKHLFFPYREYHRLTSNQHYQNRNGLAWLKRLVYTREGSHTSTDITSLAPSVARFSAVFDTGELGVVSPSLGIRLEQLHHITSRMRYANNGRLNVVAETKIPLYDIKSISVRRLVEDGHARLDEDPRYVEQNLNQDDYMYEVTLHLSPYGSRRFTPSQYYRDHAQESTARCLKDLYKHAESVKFCILGPRESWTKLKRLQTELGIRDDMGNSTNVVFVGSGHRSWRGGSRWTGGILGGRDVWNRSPSFEDEEDLLRGDWVNVRPGERYGHRDEYHDCDVDYVY
ncbi:hypothetical protein TWF730_005964 [Orbilia blumenaviensis]|uniref:Uncharacterized protein n=1 Tax=Orbilia blumenaviensis TaxID=1796055 RepID=A0AAV9VK91_9PEZI